MFAYTKIIQGIQAVTTAVTDAYFNLVTLLLNTTTTNGAQNNTFLDSSSNNFSITRNGNTTQGTFTPFSQTGWSNYFDGTGDYLSVANNTALNLSTGDFTLEAWIYVTTFASNSVILDKRLTAGGVAPWLWFTNTTGNLVFYNGTSYTTTASFQLNSWNHVAASRVGGTLYQFINGVSAMTPVSVTANLDTTGSLLIGASNDTTPTYFKGFISNVRVVKGTAVYTANFTPSTTPLTAITNTSLLTCQSNRFVDNSTNAFAITRNGDVSVQAFSPFAPTAAYDSAIVGGSGYFDGTGDYLTIADNAAFDIGASEFSIEAFVYPNGSVNSDYIFGQVTYSTAAGSYVLWVNATGFLTFYSTTGGTSATRNDITSSTVLPLNSWSHICICRSGTTLSLFLNGTRVATQTYSSTIFNATNTLAIGADAVGGGPFNGYISSLRFLKGTSAYDATQSTITIPTAPPTAVTNTQLLTNFTNAGIYDAAAKNNLETVGNAQVSTTQAKFGTTSMYFDGTGDYITIPNSPIVNLSGDFTIEAWVYRVTTGANTNIICVGSFGATANGFTFYISSTNYLAIYGNNSVIAIGTTTTIPANTWTYVAAVRSGTATNNLKLYVNGTLEVQTTNNTSFVGVAGNGMCIGADYSGSAFTATASCYIDELRLTRYARTITTPTAAFPVQ